MKSACNNGADDADPETIGFYGWTHSCNDACPLGCSPVAQTGTREDYICEAEDGVVCMKISSTLIGIPPGKKKNSNELTCDFFHC